MPWKGVEVCHPVNDLSWPLEGGSCYWCRKGVSRTGAGFAIVASLPRAGGEEAYGSWKRENGDLGRAWDSRLSEMNDLEIAAANRAVAFLIPRRNSIDGVWACSCEMV